MVKKTEAAKETKVEQKSKNRFIEFYNPETKVKKAFTIDVSKLDKITLHQEYNRDDDRHTVVLGVGGKEICFVPRLDKLGRISSYIRMDVLEVVESL
jgi:hypothetical protein